MKLNLSPQNPLEWLALQSGLIPQPILLAHFGFITSKIIWEAADSGILEALAKKPQTAAAVATQCQLNATATEALLHALTGLQLVLYKEDTFSLTAASKKWLLKSSPDSYRAQLLFDSRVCYPWLNHTGEYLRTGNGLQYHGTLRPAEWQLYQQAMAATSHHISRLAAQKIKLPATATSLLDIGGAHGLYSSALLKKYPQLSAQVFDLPEAVATQADAPNPYPERLRFVAGNILTDELPPQTYDAVIMANVAHHFTEAENLLVAQKVWAALQPGGTFYLLEFFKKDPAAAAGDMIGALQSFFFSFSSTSGLWKAAEMKNWLVQLKYQNIKIQSFVQFPGFGLVSGRKG